MDPPINGMAHQKMGHDNSPNNFGSYYLRHYEKNYKLSNEKGITERSRRGKGPETTGSGCTLNNNHYLHNQTKGFSTLIYSYLLTQSNKETTEKESPRKEEQEGLSLLYYLRQLELKFRSHWKGENSLGT